ncbi:MAG: transposase [Actinomycetota bacterium]|nr:transposase [Actinomycetota bacterium]
MPKAKRPELTRGDLRRNERLSKLRSIVRREFAIIGIDLASAKQAAVVADHQSKTLGKAMFSGSPWVIDEILDWALPIAERAGFAGLVVACEPTGHRWKPLLDRYRERGVDLVCVNAMLVARAREAEDFTKNRSDFSDATLIARLTAERRGHVPYLAEGPWSLSGTSGFAAPSCSCRRPQRARDCATCSSATGLPSSVPRRSRWSASRSGPCSRSRPIQG